MPPRARLSPGALLGYLALGLYFGLVLAKSEVISWFRIQEMFRFQAFHMYGVLGSAVLVAALGLASLRAVGARRDDGGRGLCLDPKERTPGMVRYWAGGILFGAGWALLGACPGPLYTLVGYGETVYLVALVAALAGAWTYGRLRPRLPH